MLWLTGIGVLVTAVFLAGFAKGEPRKAERKSFRLFSGF
jgi:hypothetical protein